ncbi:MULTISPECIES: exonuclease SbcCD subunit D C-terminal domain-containing protein [Leeuwenhoekiella]|uniref:Nuclease SbcCD subunit D n=1 Tax=Leeuwenhoekiella blandensis (strain CECT 7118 / CCUG 51940 / KCTC 22103 / MED217) TaxID=398720 RepID=A3XL99_LEEBM|nr:MULTISPECIES: exonuclease SbcCD subunit D C-terminal domain-containing protein [Leeuwenhoekiella]EAQ49672.1 Exonuclease SbcD [Leeuwenhoekiella blandensis MED217]MAO42261.1 exonuclease sbcCD subunit D [Leeuwenhoekiella sp.]HBT08358.1 exonuclease subunit SbcD [Leeuwenhoekiella sp.]HCW64924.1 exonuclease subunit SbcD [Leeuwenhoekiella sp.]|tara:strand:+ start:539 stop:1756 length:1218 start_codon:yes stop_codon:yes gene_type:complete
MKILHTADWHIGKKLHKHYLYTDFERFISWLIAIIQEENIELVLVSGDVFDLANPSAEARKQYYKALKQLSNLNCKLIITGGNHDSPSMLDAPREILEALNVHILGGMPENLEDCLIPVQGKQDNDKLVVAAIPFLRDGDIRAAESGVTYENRIEAIRKGIEAVFTQAAETCKQKFPGLPVIAMGHLYAAGIEPSESERDIQIGNQAAFQASQFGEYFSYVALGHIHKPQRVSAAIPAFYSGSPLPLSFSERTDEKRVLILNTSTGFEPKSVAIPTFRKLNKVSGDLERIQSKLQTLTPEGELTNLIEVELIEENFDAHRIAQLDTLVTEFDTPGLEIVKHRATFKNRLKATGKLFDAQQHLEDLKPLEVFTKMLEQNSYDEETKTQVTLAFQELVEHLNTADPA